MKMFLCSMLLIGAAVILDGCSADVGYNASPTVYEQDYGYHDSYGYYDSYPYNWPYGFWGRWNDTRHFDRDHNGDRDHERSGVTGRADSAIRGGNDGGHHEGGEGGGTGGTDSTSRWQEDCEWHE
jgi:hypothetical protein